MTGSAARPAASGRRRGKNPFRFRSSRERPHRCARRPVRARQRRTRRWPERTPPPARRGIFDQRHADAPIFAAGKIATGAVDRIDDPDPLLVEARLVVGALFRQPAIIRCGASQPRLDQVVDRDIGLRHRRRRALVQFLSSVRNNDSASAPASRTVSVSSATSRASMSRAGISL